MGDGEAAVKRIGKSVEKAGAFRGGGGKGVGAQRCTPDRSIPSIQGELVDPAGRVSTPNPAWQCSLQELSPMWVVLGGLQAQNFHTPTPTPEVVATITGLLKQPGGD